MRATTIFFIACLFTLHAVPALAGAPYEVTYQGRLLQNGDPVTTPVNIYFELFDAVSGGRNLFGSGYAGLGWSAS